MALNTPLATSPASSDDSVRTAPICPNHADGEQLRASSVVLAVGHSARGLYERLLDRGVMVTAKPFALGFRLEHPQAWLDEARYGREDAQVGFRRVEFAGVC